MQQEIDAVLTQRAHPPSGRRRTGAIVASVLLHALVASFFILAPVLAARARPDLEFVAVRIVPVQALGVPEPRPQSPAPPTPAPPAPRREPEPKPEREKPRPSPRPEAPAPPAPRAPEPAEAGPGDGGGGPRQRVGSPFGSATGTASFGAAVAGLDNPDFVYGYYVDQMLSMIGSHWVRPPVGGGVEAILHFRIAEDGRISELEILQSSGISSFDLAALRAVQRASPLPPLPRSYNRDSLGVRLVVR